LYAMHAWKFFRLRVVVLQVVIANSNVCAACYTLHAAEKFDPVNIV
jgi:hypothetical protein